MDTVSPSMRDLARRLLAASRGAAADPPLHEVVVVSERLRLSLTRFAGADGFASLLQRALALAGAEVHSLQSVRIGAGNRLEGFEQLPAETAAEAAVALAAHLLGLLATFIGEPLTMRLVREAWAEVELDIGPENRG